MTSPTTTTREELERIVRDLHHAHYTPENPNGLWKPDESPNTNTIYKVWSDGEITYEKGGFAFGDRSLKQLRGPFSVSKSFLPNFPICFGNGNSYAILTTDECYAIRGLLKEYFDPFLPKRVEVRVEDIPTADVLRRLIGEMIMSDLKVTYRSPLGDLFVVQSLMGTAEDVQSKLDTHLHGFKHSYTFVD